MLIRTNIYLQKQTIDYLKFLAFQEGIPMAKIVRDTLEKNLVKPKNWAESILTLSKLAGKSGIKDLSKRHDYYLYHQK